MDKTRKAACFAAAFTALVTGCATLQEVPAWNPPAAGSTWQMSQRNTGSYGKDAEVVLVRRDTVWKGQSLMAMTNVANGNTILARPDSKWVAITDKDGKPIMAYDPPIGYEFPMKVGNKWNTHHRVTNHLTGRTVEYDYNCNVESMEAVAVKAGTFPAFKIVCENQYSREVAWFSPEARVHVKLDFMRKPGNPSGEGTQRAELVGLNLK